MPKVVSKEDIGINSEIAHVSNTDRVIDPAFKQKRKLFCKMNKVINIKLCCEHHPWNMRPNTWLNVKIDFFNHRTEDKAIQISLDKYKWIHSYAVAMLYEPCFILIILKNKVFNLIKRFKKMTKK